MVMVVVMVSLIVAQFSMHAMGRGLQLELIKKQNRNSNLTSRARLNVGMTSRIGGLLPMRPLVPHR